MSKVSPKKLWKRIFEKSFVCPQCGSSKGIAIMLDADSYGDVECLHCDAFIHKYTKKEMKELGHYDSLTEEEKRTIDKLKIKWSPMQRVVRKEFLKSHNS